MAAARSSLHTLQACTSTPTALARGRGAGAGSCSAEGSTHSLGPLEPIKDDALLRTKGADWLASHHKHVPKDVGKLSLFSSYERKYQ